MGILKEFQKGDRLTLKVKVTREMGFVLGVGGYKLVGSEQIIKVTVDKINIGVLVFSHIHRYGHDVYNYYTEKVALEKGFYEKMESDTRGRFKEVNSMYVYLDNGRRFEITQSNIIEVVKVGLNKKYDKWVQKAIDYSNLNSDDCDIIYKAINKYKALRELPEAQKEEAYETISNALGWGKY